MKVYKFRPLVTQEDFNRAKNILETGHFWCSKFSELNDPMEGAFYEPEIEKINETFKGKNCRKICSFSGEIAFKNPILWGYYTNGFRGIAIEIDCSNQEVQEICYVQDILNLNEIGVTDIVEKVLTTKLHNWKHEQEYRYLVESDNHFHKVGKITNIYFGDPYYRASNKDKIYESSNILKEYKKYKKNLIELTKKMGE